MSLNLPDPPPSDLRAAVLEIIAMIDELKHMNILQRAAYAEKILKKAAGWMLAIADRLETKKSR